MSKEKLSESVDSAMPRDLAPQLNSPEISGDASAVQENETEKALHTLAGFYEKIKGSSNLLEDKDAQKSLKECETVFEKLTGFDLEELSKKDAHAYFEGKKQTVYKEREDLLKKVKDLYHTINEAKKDKDKKVSPKDIKRYTYIENAWDNLSDEQKKEHAGENDSEGKGAKFNFIVWLAKNRFKNIELNCQVNNVEEVVAQGGKIDASSPLSPETFMELEEKDKNFKDSYILDKEGKQKEKIKSPESHHQTEHKKLEKEFNDLILDQMYLFNDYIKEFGEKENVKAHDYFYQKFSKLKLSLPEASEKLENISLERLEKSIQSQRQKLEKYKTVAEGFRLGQDIIELKREKRGYEKAKALREYDKMMDEPMDDFKEGLKRAGWATLSFIRHPIKGTKKGINAGWSFIKNPRKFWKKSNEGVDMVGLIKELQKPKEKDLTPALEIPEPPVTYVLPKTETAPVVEATPEPSPAIIVQPKVDVVPEPIAPPQPEAKAEINSENITPSQILAYLNPENKPGFDWKDVETVLFAPETDDDRKIFNQKLENRIITSVGEDDEGDPEKLRQIAIENFFGDLITKNEEVPEKPAEKTQEGLQKEKESAEKQIIDEIQRDFLVLESKVNNAKVEENLKKEWSKVVHLIYKDIGNMIRRMKNGDEWEEIKRGIQGGLEKWNGIVDTVTEEKAKKK